MKLTTLSFAIATTLFASYSLAETPSEHSQVSDQVIATQRAELAKNTEGKGFGPQAPRDIDSVKGENKRIFSTAPASTAMNLCNIHLHKNAEHKGGEFTTYAGNGDGKGYQTGYKYNGKLTAAELAPISQKMSEESHGALEPGDTIEVHYVYTTAKVKPGETLGACLSPSIKNPQLRVETQVFVLVNDKKALDFGKLTQYGKKNGYYQALDIPTNTGKPVVYEGSTTGPVITKKVLRSKLLGAYVQKLKK